MQSCYYTTGFIELFTSIFLWKFWKNVVMWQRCCISFRKTDNICILTAKPMVRLLSPSVKALNDCSMSSLCDSKGEGGTWFSQCSSVLSPATFSTMLVMTSYKYSSAKKAYNVVREDKCMSAEIETYSTVESFTNDV